MGRPATLERSAAIEETIGAISRRMAETVSCDGSLRRIVQPMVR
jgi:hypothetical protein